MSKQRMRKPTARQLASARAARKQEMDNPEALRAQGSRLLTEYLAARQAVEMLRNRREKLGMSLADVAVLCGMSRAAINRLERGEAPNPTLRTLSRYAAALGSQLECRLVETKS